MDKTELLEALEDGRQQMLELLEGVPEPLMPTPGVVGDWSIKDILSHLAYWEGQIVTLLFQVKQGIAKPSTAHFGKETVDQVNQRWFETGRERALDQIWMDWTGVRKQTIRRVSEYSDAELNDPNRWPWLNGRALWEWVAGDSFEHEDEHAVQIQRWLETQDLSEDDLGGEDLEDLGPGSNGKQK